MLATLNRNSQGQKERKCVFITQGAERCGCKVMGEDQVTALPNRQVDTKKQREQTNPITKISPLENNNLSSLTLTKQSITRLRQSIMSKKRKKKYKWRCHPSWCVCKWHSCHLINKATFVLSLLTFTSSTGYQTPEKWRDKNCKAWGKSIKREHTHPLQKSVHIMKMHPPSLARNLDESVMVSVFSTAGRFHRDQVGQKRSLQVPGALSPLIKTLSNLLHNKEMPYLFTIHYNNSWLFLSKPLLPNISVQYNQWTLGPWWSY